MSKDWLWQSSTNRNLRYAGIAFAGLLTLALLAQLSPKSSAYSSHLSSSGNAHSGAALQSLDVIKNSTLGFANILAINLPERTDHHDGLVLATAVSGLHVEFVDGVNGNTILDKVLPPKHTLDLTTSLKGSWRAHINAISRVVENNWASALIIEDDVDWDIRLKEQLQDFALASSQLANSDSHAGVTSFRNIKTPSMPESSPYGSTWDVLWLGHCGMDLPTDPEEPTIIHEDDETVPEIRHLRTWDIHATYPLENYPQHTRVIAQQHQGTCSLAYAVSQSGARKLLYSLGLQHFNMAFDLALREWCQESGKKHTCIGVLPTLFNHHRRVGPNEIDSDISAPNGEFRDEAYTLNIRWSVRMNMDKILNGDTNYDDQWPDS